MTTPTIDLIHRHRSIRRFKPDTVPDDHIRAAAEAGQAASTSSAVQAYSVIHVTRDEERQRLAELTGPQQKVATAGAFLVICGDTRRHRLTADIRNEPYSARLEAFLLAAVDASLFAQNMVLAFESMGYGVCYIGGLRNNLPEVDALLEVPEGVYPLFGLCVGTPDETPAPRPRLPLDAVLFKDRCPDDAAMRAHIERYDNAYSDYLAARDDRPDARGWSDVMAAKFSKPRRPELGDYYRSKGADLS